MKSEQIVFPKSEKLSTQSHTLEGFELIQKDLNEIKKFDTDGFDEYDIHGFDEKIIKKGINPSIVLESNLEYLVQDHGQENFSSQEMNFHQAMRAWLHCDYNQAITFIKNKFNFDCTDNLDFAKKYKFLSFVSVLIFENRNVDEEVASKTPIVSNEQSVFSELRKSIGNQNNSFLLEYFAKDFLDVIDEKRDSVMGGALEFKPYEIAPKTFAFDKNSHFCMVSKNNLEDQLYVSNPNDYTEISKIINNSSDHEFLSQEDFDKLATYFSPTQIQGRNNDNLDVQIYRKINEPYHREKIKEITGIEINKLRIDEQFYFLNYLKFANEETLEKVKEFSHEFSINGFRTFLSIEKGGKEMGDKILALGEKLPTEVSEKLFKKYSEIVEETNTIENTLSEFFKNDRDVSEEQINSIKDSLLKKGKDLLIEFSNLTEKEQNVNTQEFLINKLDDIKQENIIFSSIFASLKKSGEKISFKDVKDLKLDKVESTDQLTPKEITEMEKIYKENYSDKPELFKTLLQSFKNIIDTGYNHTDFYMLKHKGEIVSFCRFDYHMKEKEVYFGSFNVNKNFGNGMIGSTMLEEVVNTKAHWTGLNGFMMRADCSATAPISSKYIESGFVATQAYELAGELSLEIKRDDGLFSNTFELKGLPIEELKKRDESGMLSGFTHCKQFDSQSDIDFSLLDKGFILTRYFFDTESKKWWVGFEKPNRDPFDISNRTWEE